MLADVSAFVSETQRLPNLGKLVPLTPRQRKNRRPISPHESRSVRLLTLLPKNRQLMCSIASRGGAWRARKSPSTKISGIGASLIGAEWSPADLAPRVGCSTSRCFRCDCNAQPPAGAFPRVDTKGPSDRIENRKTSGISIGSASFVPPGTRAIALLRQPVVTIGRWSGRRVGSSFLGCKSTNSNDALSTALIPSPYTTCRPFTPSEHSPRLPRRDAHLRPVVAPVLLRSRAPSGRESSKCGMRFAMSPGRKASRPVMWLANEETAI